MLWFPPDGKHVYAASNADDAVAVFEILDDGSLSYQAMYKDGVDYGDGAVDGLNGARSIVISDNGNYLYAGRRGS